MSARVVGVLDDVSRSRWRLDDVSRRLDDVSTSWLDCLMMSAEISLRLDDVIERWVLQLCTFVS